MLNMLPALVLIPLYVVLPAVLLYFVVKLAVKNAIKESREEGENL